MAQLTDAAEAQPESPALKVVEPEVNADAPWADDVLKRRAIAARLTSIVRGQEAPFVISVDGSWGTGKTFLLKRWQQDLANDGWQAIYFNAWEDDFADDPLLAIVGQLADQFEEDKLQQVVHAVGMAAVQIITARLAGTAINLDELTPESLLDRYRDQSRTKATVKDHLRKLAAKVREETDQPLVFIIDELDRCRPTFAIELLERVKHIFDVPNIVFVFGINRGELVNSLRSVYGKIDAGTYLRRFFDMEFVLPDANPMTFCNSLLDRYQVDHHFSELMKHRGQRVPNSLRDDSVGPYLGVISELTRLSLRDIDYCVRLLSLAMRSLDFSYALDPGLFSLLISIKIINPELYCNFVNGVRRGADVINFIDGLTSSAIEMDGSIISRKYIRSRIEAAAYCADDGPRSFAQIEAIRDKASPPQPDYVSSETAHLDPEREEDAERIRSIMSAIEEYLHPRRRPVGLDAYAHHLRRMAKQIDLWSGMLER